MKVSPASTLRNTDSMVRIKSPHMGERKTIHVLYIVSFRSGYSLKVRMSFREELVSETRMRTPAYLMVPGRIRSLEERVERFKEFVV